MIYLTDKQTEAIQRFKWLKVGAVFMEQGAGKSRVAIELANHSAETVLWVAPYSTLPTVVEQVETWDLRTPVRFVGYETLSASDTTYLDILAWARTQQNLMLIADESIFIKNAESKRTKRMNELRKFATYALCLNGTPVTRDLWDLKRQMDFLSPKILDMNDSEFLQKYFKQISYKKANGDRGDFQEIYEPNIAHLKSLIAPYVYEAALDLGIDETWNIICHAKSYDDWYGDVKKSTLTKWKSGTSKVQLLSMLTRLNVIASTDPVKCESVAKRVENTHSVVFCTFKEELNQIGQHIDHFKIEGSTTSCERNKIFAKHRKQHKPLLMTYGVGSFGLNLQYIHEAHFASLNFDYARIEQARSRINRLGQTTPIEYTIHRSGFKISEFIDKNLQNKEWLAQLVRQEINLEEEL